MKINIQGVGVELTEAIKDYINKKIGALEKFIRTEGGEIFMDVEIGKTSNKHKQGELFKTEINLSFDGKKFYTISDKEDLYASIDDAKEEMEYQLVQSKDREDTLFRRGARSIKKMMKGLSKRNPFTSKY
jgi:putative sigma-54 modulation protein